MKTRNLIAAALLALPLAAQAQATIDGYVENLKADKVYLSIRGEAVDSSAVIDGRFHLESTVPDVNYCLLHTPDYQWQGQFWLTPTDKVKITVAGNVSEITGAPEEDLYQLYRQALADIEEEEKNALAESDKAFEEGYPERSDKWRNYLDTVLKQKEDSVFMEFARQHPSSYAVMNHIYNCRVLGKYDYPRYDAMFRLLDQSAFKGRQWDTLLRIRETDAKLQPGHPFPVLELTDVYDTKVSTADYKGKCLLVVFGNAAFDDYKAALPVFKELYAKYQPKGYEQLDIVFAKDKEVIIKLVSQNDLPWAVASDWKDWETPMSRDMGIDHICQNFLLDKDGNIVARNVWGDNLRRAVEKCMNP